MRKIRAKVTARQEDTKPTVDEWRYMNRTGRRISVVRVIAGLSFAGILTGIFTWFDDTLPATFKGWLRIR